MSRNSKLVLFCAISLFLACFAASFVAAVDTALSTDNLVADLSFGEGSTSSKTLDSSIYKNDGFVYGAKFEPSGGHDGKGAYSFNGSAVEYIELNKNENLFPKNGSLTVSGWVYPIDNRGSSGGYYFKPIFSIGTNVNCLPGAGWSIGAGSSTEGLRLFFNDGENKVCSYLIFDKNYAPTNLLNKWTHIAVVFDRTNAMVYSYVNGVKQKAALNISRVTGNVLANRNISIGRAGGRFGDSQMNGLVDDVKIYGSALDDAQIKALYEGKIAPSPTSTPSPTLASILNSVRVTSSESSLVADLSFGEGSSSSKTLDSSSHKNNGFVYRASFEPSGGHDGGGAYSFDGRATNYIMLKSDESLFPGEGSLTVSGWVFQRNYSYPRTVFPIGNNGAYSSTKAGWSIGAGYNANGLRLNFNDGKKRILANLDFDKEYSLENILNKWTHIAVVFDRTSGKAYAYVNGVKQKAEVDISKVAQDVRYTEAIRIGYLAGWRMDGLIDDVKIYSTALSENEVKSLYAGKKVSVCVPTDPSKEVCDGLDNDCNGQTDMADPSCNADKNLGLCELLGNKSSKDIGWVLLDSNGGGLCCGDNEGEWFKKADSEHYSRFNTACCNSSSSCVGYSGTCVEEGYFSSSMYPFSSSTKPRGPACANGICEMVPDPICSNGVFLQCNSTTACTKIGNLRCTGVKANASSVTSRYGTYGTIDGKLYKTNKDREVWYWGDKGVSEEICGDGIDNDCDGKIDEGCVWGFSASCTYYTRNHIKVSRVYETDCSTTIPTCPKPNSGENSMWAEDVKISECLLKSTKGSEKCGNAGKEWWLQYRDASSKSSGYDFTAKDVFACCDQSSDCVDSKGKCVNNNVKVGKLTCSYGIWYTLIPTKFTRDAHSYVPCDVDAGKPYLWDFHACGVGNTCLIKRGALDYTNAGVCRSKS